MVVRVVAITIALGLVSGCGATGVFACETDSQCGAGGRCEQPAGFCSFDDNGCTSGRRYDDYAGAGLAGICVGEEPCTWPYAATNVDPCAVGGVQPTFHPPAGTGYQLNTSNGEWTTGEETPYQGPSSTTVQQAGGTMVRVLNLAGFELENNTSIEIRGSLPLILIVQGSASIAGDLSVSAGEGQDACGMGAKGAKGTNASTGNGAAGGGGGGFGSAGAAGGVGGTSLAAGTAGMISGDSSLSPLRGGCSGGDGGASVGSSMANGGRGGGAIQIIVRDTLTLSGTIDAGGQGGDGGSPNANGAGGGGGGGAGGAIFCEANTLKVDSGGRVCANGGSGGEGGGDTLGGANGNEGTCSATTGAMTSDNVLGGDGGRGGFAMTAPGMGAAGGSGVGGGGGGGGAVGRTRLRGDDSRSIDGAAVITPPAVP